MEIVSSIEDSREIATWGETILGVLPVLTFSLVLYLVGKEVSIPIPVTGLCLVIMLILPIMGILVAWKRDRWGWFPPYFGLILLDLFLIQVIMFYQIGENIGLLWTLRGVAILFVLFITYFVVTLYRQPAARPKAAVKIDMLNILLGMVTWVPGFVVIYFGANPDAYPVEYFFFSALIPALGVAIYLRSRWRWLQVAGLLAVCLDVFFLARTIY